jgi:hypothetical protein
MEKAGSVDGGAGEATLSDENTRKKESVGAWE